MNKFLWAFVFILAFVYADQKTSSSEENLKEVASLLEDKFNVTIINEIVLLMQKTKEQCPDIVNKIDTTVGKIAECIDAIDLSSDTFCSLIRKNFATCAEPARKLSADCLPQEFKELPSMAIKIISAVVDQACNSTVEQIIELFNPCIIDDKLTASETCTKLIYAFEHRNKLLTKNLICKILPHAKQCSKDHQEKSCKNPVTKQALFQFTEAIDRATAEDCQEINKA